MHDLEVVANIVHIYWLLPLGIAIGLALTSAIRATVAGGGPRIYAAAAAICLGSGLLSLWLYPLGYLPLVLLALLGLGTWAASLFGAPRWLLLSEAVIVPLSVASVVLFL